MPYKFEYTSRLIPDNLKKNRKLSNDDILEIKRLRAEEGLSHNELAKMFNVTRGAIAYHIVPGKKEQQQERAKNVSYYDKEKNNIYMRTHRARKQELYKAGKLICLNKNMEKD